MNKDAALKFVDNAKIAEQLKELYGGDWQVSSDFDGKTGKINMIANFDEPVETIHFTLKFPLSAWNDAFNTDKNCAHD